MTIGSTSRLFPRCLVLASLFQFALKSGIILVPVAGFGPALADPKSAVLDLTRRHRHTRGIHGFASLDAPNSKWYVLVSDSCTAKFCITVTRFIIWPSPKHSIRVLLCDLCDLSPAGQSRQNRVNRRASVLLPGQVKSSTLQSRNNVTRSHRYVEFFHNFHDGIRDSKRVYTGRFAAHSRESGDGTAQPRNFFIELMCFHGDLPESFRSAIKRCSGFVQGGAIGGHLVFCHKRSI